MNQTNKIGFVFDLDGTLINSLAAIHYHLNKTLEDRGFQSISIERVQDLVGNSSRYLVYHALDECGGKDLTEEEREEVLDQYNEAYLNQPLVKTEAYPGIQELLETLRKENVKLAVYSNKPEDIVVDIVSKIFPQGSFDLVRGFREDTKRKPDPEGLYKLLDAWSIGMDEAIYIGDSEVDAKLGVNAKMDTVLVTYGFRSRQDLEDLTYTALLDGVEELEAYLLQCL